MGDPAEAGGSQTDVEVFEVEKEARVESAQGPEHLASEKHEAPGDDRRVPDDGPVRERFAHFVPIESLFESLAKPGWRESAQTEVEHRGIALAQRLGFPVPVAG